ncbi:outer membrane beta-barrel protein [Pararhodonellum marinum]|uniref:outer membrane beta-barrel protein n=1 Tax=Pararhodonellum marinum TaxID=2755358 RepID=UPI00189097D2|nr:outer membrane beta-barrel protein [Pararhodonellum marinum]
MAALFLIVPAFCQGQILISLLFGDALNTDKIEFGITGGMNRSDLRGIEDAQALNNFNLGFYFNILLMENSYLSTGLLVKSNVGARGMATYPLGDPGFDGIFEGGALTTKINYFYLPVMWQQRIQSRWLLEGGLQAGIRTRAFDFFDVEFDGGDVEYQRDVRSDYGRFDAGVVGGVGYKLKEITKSMSVGFLYYHGLVDVLASSGQEVRNSSLYLYLRIPIGGNKPTKQD